MSPAPPPSSGLERYWPRASLRHYLVAMILLATLPLAALVCWQILADVRAEQGEIEANLTRSASALAQAVDSEIHASFDALGTLGQSDLLDAPQPRLRMLRERPPRRDWHSVFLLDAQGHLLFDSADAQASGAIAGELGQLHERVLRQRQPVVWGLVPVRAPQGHAVMLAVPVVRAGEVRHVLGARVAGSAWQRLAASASRPEGGYALLHDASLRLIGWTVSPNPPLGMALGADAATSIGSRPSGVQRMAGVDGLAVYSAWQQVPSSGWTVQVAIPARPIESAHRQAILAALSVSGASLLVGVLLAVMVARRIAGPLQALAMRGPGGLPGRVAVREISILRDALQAAARHDEEARRTLEDDIAKRKKVEAQLLAAHEQLQASQHLIDLAQEAGRVGFFHYRFEDDRLTWTPGHCRLFGVEALEPPRLARWFELMAASERAASERDFWTACALQRQMQTLEYEVPRPDGERRWLSSRVLLRYGPEGKPVQMTGVTVDMTDQREAELRRAELTEQAVAARQAAEAASRAKDEFLSMLGHELRNPLGAISAAIDVLEAAEPGGATALEARTIIARQTRNLSHMMSDLLDVGRVIAGKILLARQPVNLAQVFERVRRTSQLTGEAGGHDLHMDVSDAWVDGDAVRLEQVMTNLLTNAIKYTPGGRRIEVMVGLRGDRAVFDVKDSGMGIPASLLPHVFELFVQGERTLDRRAGGLGIGLTLVKRLVELHGGTVAAESSASGSRFTVELPAIAPPLHPEGDALPPSRRRRVLVIEDNADVLAALRSKLELDGHTVSTAADGIEGLTRLLRQQPEVSIVDIGLPGLTGYEVARHARAAGYAGRLIALSGYGQERDRSDALVAGFDGYLVKPVDHGQLRASLSAE
ncbi:response regulator [Ramlibacter henchirensis]|uniref:histidine kinase n=1 Tax=Ramlibacter henchirensis TaxID=204072 RepID=A0A4Z0BT84_9BURK|nr:ATP-binding protein [Ramlibacter henchirensis]TFZ02506.1 response regulator [Ramlibacter henchirensis]